MRLEQHFEYQNKPVIVYGLFSSFYDTKISESQHFSVPLPHAA